MTNPDPHTPWSIVDEDGELYIETAAGVPLFDNADKLPIETMRKLFGLAAAAPDLLAALKVADTILDGMPLYATGRGALVIHSAIAKAEGTTA